MARFAAELDGEDVEGYLENAAWIPLLKGVTKLRWQFLNPASGKFEEDWTAAPEEIAAVLLEMTLADGREVSAIFRIPKVARRSESGLKVAQLPASAGL